MGKSIFYSHEHTSTHTQTCAHQWNRSKIRRRRECRRRPLRRGSGRREAGQGGIIVVPYHGRGHRRAPSPLLHDLRRVCDEMPRRNPIMPSYIMYVIFSSQIPSDITRAPPTPPISLSRSRSLSRFISFSLSSLC